MNSILRKTAMASALAIAAMAFSNVSIAQDTDTQMPKKCIGEACPGQGGQGKGQGANSNDQEQMNEGQMKKLRKKSMQQNDQVQDMQSGEDQGDNTGQMKKKLRKKGTQSTEQYQDDNDNDQIVTRKKVSQSNFKYESGRHHRRRSKDATFRFYFGGYWYDRPYWEEDYYVTSGYGGISCRQGRNIVAERFNRVRVVECRGRTYTYIGRRHGDDFEVVLSSRSGRIINVDEI
jgi:hypothetical protein